MVNMVDNFLQQNILPSQQSVIDFHRFTGDGDRNNDLLMDRDGQYQTVSITSIELNDNKTKMQYLDLHENKTYRYEAFPDAEMIK